MNFIQKTFGTNIYLTMAESLASRGSLLGVRGRSIQSEPIQRLRSTQSNKSETTFVLQTTYENELHIRLLSFERINYWLNSRRPAKICTYWLEQVDLKDQVADLPFAPWSSWQISLSCTRLSPHQLGFPKIRITNTPNSKLTALVFSIFNSRYIEIVTLNRDLILKG